MFAASGKAFRPVAGDRARCARAMARPLQFPRDCLRASAFLQGFAMTEEERITVTIDGRTIDVEPTLSIIEAAARCDALTANVGCMGQGVCGACRCLVR
ncbi:2Fe-2S iron-sulfur cluster-binding protein, partial [Ralstonia pseudosolanacearum]